MTLWNRIVLLLLAISLACPSQGRDALPETVFQRGAEAFERGAFAEAVESWREAARLYAKVGATDREITAIRHTADALSALGHYGQAVESLRNALELAERSGNVAQKAFVLAGLGSVYVAVGPASEAESYLRRSLSAANQLGDDGLTAVVLNNLGNAMASQGDDTAASVAYEQSASLAQRRGLLGLQARALANAAAGRRRLGAFLEAYRLLDQTYATLRELAPTHDTAVVLVNAGVEYRELSAVLPVTADELRSKSAAALKEAISIAEKLQDRRTSSYAWGHLAALYAGQGRDYEALELTYKAILAAQQVAAPESLYRWQWQAGRLLARSGQNWAAIDAYRRTVHTLQSIRPELAATHGSTRGSFRETIGSIYLELVDLLLRQADSARGAAEISALLSEARDTAELFKVAELRDYFRDECVDAAMARATPLDVVSRTAVIVYPILLPDRIELLLSLPGGLTRVPVPVPESAVTRVVREFRRTLEKRTTRQFLPHAQQLYAWLIQPIEPALSRQSIDTLVFVPDGPLRTIPMSALHDGERFLAERYAVAITPGLSLTDPQPLGREKVKVLAAGLTAATHGHAPLPNVSVELEALRQLFQSTVLLNEEFRMGAFEQKLRRDQFTIVHIASHGQFEDNVEASFLLAFDDKLTIDRLSQMIGLLRFRDEPLELLTLSACDTAAGDDRAALGLAGVAVKAGARSALATLWEISDDASAILVAEFYRGLRVPAVSRAEALRRAQLRLLADPRWRHPGFWSPFLLINNWL